MRGSDVTAQEPKNSKGQHPERGWIGEGAANSHGDEDEDGFNSSGNGGKDTRCERYRMRNGNKLSVGRAEKGRCGEARGQTGWEGGEGIEGGRG